MRASLLWIGIGALSVVHASEGLEGCWCGHAILEGRATPVAIGLDDGRAMLRLPVIHAEGFPFGAYRVEAGSVRIGPMTLSRDGEHLRGRLPAGLDPADPLDVTFRRTAWLAPDCVTRRGAPALEPVWAAQLGAGVWADPLVDPAGARIFLGTLDGKILALDARDGTVAWSAHAGGSIRSALQAHAGSLLVAADDGKVRALSMSDGTSAWEASIAPPSDPTLVELPGADYHYRGHQVLALEDAVIVGTLAGDLIELDPGSGRERRRVALDGAVTALAIGPEGDRYAATWPGTLHELSPALEERARFSARGTIHGDLLVTGGAVIVGDRGYYTHAVDARSGEARWSRKLWFSWIESGPQIQDGVLFLGSSDAQVVQALDPESGATLWAAPLGGRALGRPALGPDYLAQGISGEEGYLSAMTAGLAVLDPVTGEELARLPLPMATQGISGIVTTAVLLGDIIVAADVDGQVRALRLTGRPS